MFIKSITIEISGKKNATKSTPGLLVKTLTSSVASSVTTTASNFASTLQVATLGTGTSTESVSWLEKEDSWWKRKITCLVKLLVGWIKKNKQNHLNVQHHQ